MSRAKREAILAAQDWDVQELDVPGWGRIGIRSLSALERLSLAQEFTAETVTNGKACEFFCRLIALAVIDDDGKQVFSEQDTEQLARKNWARLEMVSDAILRFNGMKADAVETAKKN